ncbi:MAG: hypothetical protein WAM09_08785 [Anaerolineales bacterium]
MDFGYVLKRAWEIIWKFKVLWIFGILASCGQASGSSGSNSGYRFSSHESNISPQIQRFFNQLDLSVIAILIAIGIIIALALIVLAILLGTVGRVGLIRGTMKAEQGAERLTFGELWRDGLTYFWRVFGLNLIIGLIIFAVILALFIVGAILTGLTLGLFLVCLIPLICLIIPVMWAVSVVIEQANVALVVENLSITEGIKRGWQVVWANLGTMIVMSLILILGVGLIGGAIIGLPLLVVAAPLVVGVTTGTAEAIRNGLLVSGVFFIIYLPVLLVLSGILRAYTSSAWTLTFLRLTQKPSQQQLEAPSIPENSETPPA